MQKTCRQCSARFEVTQDDLAFYEKVSPVFNGKKELIPPPTLCPECRQQRRLSFRNERSLYYRKCDRTGKQMVAQYSPDQPFVVYGHDAWFSDQWDPLSFGQSFDASKTFTAQFSALLRLVPRLNLVNSSSENSEYANWVIHLKNCYLLTASREDVDCYYGHWLWRSRDCIDCAHTFDSERCYACTDCYFSYALLFSRDCIGCRQSAFLHDCQQCHDCFGCVGLQHKQYCFGNEQLSEEEYRKRTGAYLPLTPATVAAMEQYLTSVERKVPHKSFHGSSAEDCSGDYIVGCQRCQHCFDIEKSQDSRHADNIMQCKNVQDCSRTTLCELAYENLSAVNSYNVLFSVMCWYCQDVQYCDSCLHCKHLFGCTGLRSKEYCIFNRQYTKDEYETIVPRIIARMRQVGEWGEFLTVSVSPFGYNETVAQEYFPLTRESVMQRQWRWHEMDAAGEQHMGPAFAIPDAIVAVPDDIVRQILHCSVTGKPYKIIPQELKFYREMNIPIPRKCPDQRHKERMALRNPRKLWKRQCMKCQKPIETTYAPERPEIVYCESCYLTSVY